MSVAVDVLNRAYADARRMEATHRDNFEHYMGLAERERELSAGYAQKADILYRAIHQLGGKVEEVTST